MPSTWAANPYTIPDWSAASVDLPISALRLRDVDLGQPCGAGGERLDRDLDPGRDDPAQVLAGARDHVVVDRGPEVHDHAGVAGRGRSRRPRSRAGRARARAGCRAGSACRSWCRGRRSAPRAPGSARTCGGTRTRAAAPRRRPPRRRSGRSRCRAAPSRSWIMTASSSPVDWRSVEKRQCSTSSAPSKAPTWVCVLPTSIVSSIGGDYPVDRPQRRDPARPAGRAAALPAQRLQRRAVRERQLGLELEQRHEHEAAAASPPDGAGAGGPTPAPRSPTSSTSTSIGRGP